MTAPLAAPPRVGLLSVARPIDQPEREWVNGFSFEPEACSGAGVYDPCVTGPDVTTAVPVPANRAVREFTPFPVRAYDRCSTFGWAARDWQGRATRALLAQQSFQLEKELWRGDLARSAGWSNPFLASLDTDVVATGATVEQGLACLDASSTSCNSGQRLMIHAPRQIVIAWSALNFLRYEGGLILTANDNIVVPGAGYDGSGPPGIIGGPPTPAATGSVWAYATDIIEVRLGEVHLYGGPTPQGTNRTTNVFTTTAERLAAATWNGCCLLAASMNVTLCDIGGS